MSVKSSDEVLSGMQIGGGNWASDSSCAGNGTAKLGDLTEYGFAIMEMAPLIDSGI